MYYRILGIKQTHSKHFGNKFETKKKAKAAYDKGGRDADDYRNSWDIHPAG